MAGILLAVVFCLLGLLVLWLFASEKDVPLAPAVLGIIAVETITPTVQQNPTPFVIQPTYVGSEIAIDIFVQISGTDGAGLRLRSGPGLENPPEFLGMDAEVFKVRDGPIESDGFTWWFLVAPYDENRNGWAASDYLEVVTGQ
ncbi:MAG: hypothetical protein MUO76_13275 [Anaerolineaceae bacterium]|nr:hypothetical protein [Anaerolineaceae bacterium]